MADWRDSYPENVSVLSCDEGIRSCCHCGERGLVFQGHFWKENKIVAGCKQCLTTRAGGADKVYVRETPCGTRPLWQRNARDAEKSAKAARMRAARTPNTL